MTTLLFFKLLQILAISFPGHILLRDEEKSGGIDAITKSRWLRAVIKNVPEVRIGVLAPHFSSHHKENSIFHFNNIVRLNGLCKAWPSGAGIKLVQRDK